MARPTLRDVTNWRRSDMSNAHALVECGTLTTPDGFVHHEGAYSVRDLRTGKRRLFYGESAWSDAQRLADDLYWKGAR
jgi:hypothetical protein